jgi:WD40 repeat protein
MKSLVILLFSLMISTAFAQYNVEAFEDSLFKVNNKTKIISENGKYSINFSKDKKGVLKHIKSDTHLRTFRGNFIYNTVKFSNNNKYIASGSWGKFAQLWETNTARYIRTFKGHESWITAIEFSNDSKFLATGSQDFTAKLWDVSDGTELLHFIGHSSFITSVSFSPNGKYLITKAWDGSCKLWEIQSGEEKKTFFYTDEILFFGELDDFSITQINKKSRD